MTPTGRRDFLMQIAALARSRQVVLAVCDGLRASDVKTPGPNLARLASQGVWFERAYAACPAPEGSRAALLTGRFPHNRSNPALLEVQRLNRASFDRELGGVLDRAAAEAVVVFTSGYGEMRGAHGLDGFDQPYEECIHVPLVIRGPKRLAAGTRDDRLASTVDILPTVLELSGLTVPEGLDGVSLTRERAASVFAEGRFGQDDEWRLMIRGFDKIVINRAGEVTHLYNLAEDPEESVNEAAARTGQLRKDELRAQIEVWRRRTGDGRSGSGLKRRGK